MHIFFLKTYSLAMTGLLDENIIVLEDEDNSVEDRQGGKLKYIKNDFIKLAIFNISDTWNSV